VQIPVKVISNVPFCDIKYKLYMYRKHRLKSNINTLFESTGEDII